MHAVSADVRLLVDCIGHLMGDGMASSLLMLAVGNYDFRVFFIDMRFGEQKTQRFVNVFCFSCTMSQKLKQFSIGCPR